MRLRSKWSGTITFAVIVAIVALPLAWFEYLARMRAEGLCKSLAVGMTLPHEAIDRLASVESLPGGQRTAYVEPGVIPGSRHVCTITELDRRVVAARIDHQWSFD